MLIWLFAFLAMIIWISVISQLKFIYIVMLSTVAFLVLLLSIVWSYSFIYMNQEFNELSNALQHLIVNYRSYHKTYISLSELYTSLEGDLREDINDIVTNMDHGLSISSSSKDFCLKYNHFIVLNLFRTLSIYDEYGAIDIKESLRIIEADIDDWIEDNYLFRKKLKQVKNQLLLACALSLSIFMMAKNMLLKVALLHQLNLYQISTFIYFLIVECCVLFAFRVLKKPWLSQKERVDQI